MKLDHVHRRALSRLLGGMHVALGVLWVGPWHGAPAAGRISPVQTFNELVPWAPLFFAVAIALLGCSYAKRSMVIPHALGCVLMGVFASLATLAALPVFGQSFGSLVTPVMALSLAGVHFLMQRSYVMVGVSS
ncbi:hypothetical protein ACWEOE_10945 [Amycolatopsis sp. NPDC004368]